MFARVVALFFITMNYISRSTSEDALDFNWNLTLRFRNISLNQLREEWKSGGRWFALLALRDPSSNPIKTNQLEEWKSGGRWFALLAFKETHHTILLRR
ncbi:hypothetical protein AVEN_229795-1 [Araneus ventricosus]|uniref:Uncharacterized protein n=1 Tax=Araneus ventricosus TaxID=182803 RepID=A0A4Y2XA00_ARAVE|nr:hypothetical protein AVEN_229795-1 [Araneus ventricosus]